MRHDMKALKTHFKRTYMINAFLFKPHLVSDDVMKNKVKANYSTCYSNLISTR